MEQPRTLWSLKLEIPPGVEYRPVGEDGEVPEHFGAIFRIHSARVGVSELGLDLAWNAKEGKFDILKTTLVAPKGGSVDSLAGVRSLYLSVYREASRQVVRVRMGAVDGRDASTLERAATLYRLAKAAGDSPTKAVADQLGISRDAAAQQVRRARQAGLLPKVRLIRRPPAPPTEDKRKRSREEHDNA